jgi:3-hydroxyisobutyrate dehydrogenase
MGIPMAGRLLHAGYAVFGFDPSPEAERTARDAGLVTLASLAELVERADAVIVSVPDPDAVETVFLSEGGLLERAQEGAVVVDVSTSTPALARRLAALGAQRHIAVLDAPVSGGPIRAAAGDLVVMVGGPKPAVRQMHPALSAFGEVVHVGAAGCGQATKLCNNLLAGIHMVALSESLALAAREGLDPHQLFAVLSRGTGDSAVLRTRFPAEGVVPAAPANDRYKARFPVALMRKDLRLALETAASHDLELPLVREAAERYAEAGERGWDDRDYSVIDRLAPRD